MMSLSPSIRTRMVSPRVSPASPASTLSWAGQSLLLCVFCMFCMFCVFCVFCVRRTTSESASRHRPPNSSTWASGSLNEARLVYCSGRLRARTAAAAGRPPRPGQPAARPPKESTAHPPISGVVTSAAGIPPSQTAAARTSGIPVMNCGTIPESRG